MSEEASSKENYK